MPGLPSIPIFQVLVLLPTGLPFVGARLRVFNAQNADVTYTLTGESVLTTDVSGQVAVFLRSAEVVPAGIYRIVTANPGYADASVSTPGTFTGPGSFSMTVAARTIAATPVPQPGARFVSPMAPVLIHMPAPEVAAGDWQLIETTITDSAGVASVIETPVVGGSALVNLQTRMRLKPGLHLVPDSETSMADPDFSGVFTVTARSITPAGTLPLPGSAVYSAANMLPTGPANDLIDYTDTGDDYAKWIVDGEVVKFRGHYLDVMIWLPQQRTGPKRAVIGYYTAGNQFLSESMFVIQTSDNVLRIAIPDAPDGATAAKVRCLNEDSDDISEILTITYHG